MYLKYALLTCIIGAASAFEIPKPKLKTNIFYESLDQSSIEFFSSKLKDYYNHIHDFVDVHLVPFGNAQLKAPEGATGTMTIVCKNGDVECYGNKVHACALHLLTKTDDEVAFVICTMSNIGDPKTVTKDTYPAKKCIQLLNVPELSTTLLDECIAKDSMKLLESYANETKKLNPISHLPVITLNADPFDAQLSSDFVHNFQDAACKKLAGVPGISAVCDHQDGSSTTPAPQTTTTHPNSATIVSTAYLPFIVAIVLTVLFQVKLHY